jgi:hypothetical protein
MPDVTARQSMKSLLAKIKAGQIDPIMQLNFQRLMDSLRHDYKMNGDDILEMAQSIDPSITVSRWRTIAYKMSGAPLWPILEGLKNAKNGVDLLEGEGADALSPQRYMAAIMAVLHPECPDPDNPAVEEFHCNVHGLHVRSNGEDLYFFIVPALKE